MNYHFYKRHSVFSVLLIILFLTALGRQLGHIAVPGIAPAVASACPQAQPSEKIPLRILYVGLPDTERQKDFVSFLTPYFKAVKTADLYAFKEEQAKDCDVVVIDSTGIDEEPLNIIFSDQYSRATVTIGVPGASLARKNKLNKIGYT